MFYAVEKPFLWPSRPGIFLTRGVWQVLLSFQPGPDCLDTERYKARIVLDQLMHAAPLVKANNRFPQGSCFKTGKGKPFLS
jgi:hypothetical protein